MEKKDILSVYQNSQGEVEKVRRKFLFLGGFFNLSAQGMLIIGGIIGAILLIIAIGTYFWFAQDIYSKDRLMNRNNSGLTLLDKKGDPFFTFYQAKRATYIPLSQIPKSTQQSVIAIEDKDFYEHPGFSITGIVRSIVVDIKKEELSQGGSTITQQLVKNVLLTAQKNFLRKYQEIVLAIELDRVYSKDEILEMYLNSVYFGEGAFGIEAASQVYFGKSTSDLSLAESSMLAAILNAPSVLSPLSGSEEAAQERQQLVLQKMVEQGFINETQKEEAVAAKLTYTSKKESDLNEVAPHFALWVKSQLEKMYGEEAVARSGMKVKTTLDISWQRYAEEAVKNQVTRLASNKASNGAAVAIDPKTGEVRVMVGSKDWYDQNFGKMNMALAPRQPGSSFKPIVYGAALEKRLITPATVLKDEETTFPGNYKPKDYDGKYRGDVLVRRALSNSLNIPAVEVMQKLGVNSALSKALEMGITTLKSSQNYGLSLVLGSGEVPLLEMTNAYTTFANYGTIHNIKSVLEVTDKNDRVIYKAKDTTKKALSEQAAFLITSILSDNNARAEQFGGSLTISRPAAVKTGTSEDYRDSLTIGYTPSLVVGVWVGNNDYTAMDRVAGSLGAAPIWRSLMETFLKGTPVETFKNVRGLSTTLVCKDKGLRVAEPSDSAYQEYFIVGTEPTQMCAIQTPEPSPTPEESSQPSESPSPTVTPFPTITPLPTITPRISPSIIPTPTPVINIPQ